jgi:hypothetical protein
VEVGGGGARPPRRRLQEGCGGPSRAKGKSRRKNEERAGERSSRRKRELNWNVERGQVCQRSHVQRENGGIERSEERSSTWASRGVFLNSNGWQAPAGFCFRTSGSFRVRHPGSPVGIADFGMCRSANHVAPHPPDVQSPPSQLPRARRFSSYVLIF